MTALVRLAAKHLAAIARGADGVRARLEERAAGGGVALLDGRRVPRLRFRIAVPRP